MIWEVLNAARDLGRIHDLATILVRYGLGDFAARIGVTGFLERAGKALHVKHGLDFERLSTAQRVARALQEMGPCYVKLGQVLATRPDVLPPDWIAEFEQLQDDARAVPWEELSPQLTEDLGTSPEEVFLEVDREPLAAGSIAQAHRARLLDGTAVVLKVRRPGIRPVIEADLRLMERLARIAEDQIPEMRRFQPVSIVRQFIVIMRRELDLASECRYTERAARNFQGHPYVVMARIFWEYSCERLSVQSYIDGIRARDHQAIEAAGLDRRLLARRGAEAVLKMILVDGFFHADPHPGNVLFLEDNRLAFIDFGMVGHLTGERQRQLADLLQGFVNREPDAVIEVLRSWSDDPKIDTQVFKLEIHAMIDNFHGMPLQQFSLSTILSDLTDVLREHAMQLPSDLAILIKTLYVLEGFGRQLDPEFDMVAVAEPFLQRLFWSRYLPHVMLRQGWRQVRQLLDLLEVLPRDLRRLIQLARHGALQINVNVQRLEEFGDQLDRAASRLTVGLVTSALIVGSSIAMTVQGGPTVFGLPAFGFVGFAGAGIGGLWLLISIWRAGSGNRSR